MWPFQIIVSVAKKKNVFLKTSAKSIRYRWSAEVILVFAKD